jgi:2-phospho-L-lactate guanylyltransferase
MPALNDAGPGWTMVLPLKGGPAAKSRLGAPATIATAIALDCLDAVLAADRVDAVVVVTADLALAALAQQAGAAVHPESVPGGGLLAAVTDGLRGLSGPVAVLLADLPALRPVDLSIALRRARTALEAPAAAAMAFVPDAEGTGTVLLAALGPGSMAPCFGPDSAGLHEAAGALRLELDLPRLRRDVDTPADLDVARSQGLGRRTRAALCEISA